MCRDERRARLMRRLFYPTGERREDGDPWELADVSFLVGFSHERVREEIIYGTLKAFRLRRTYLIRQPHLIAWLEAIGFLERRHPGERRRVDRGEDRRTMP